MNLRLLLFVFDCIFVATCGEDAHDVDAVVFIIERGVIFLWINGGWRVVKRRGLFIFTKNARIELSAFDGLNALGNRFIFFHGSTQTNVRFLVIGDNSRRLVHCPPRD